MKKIGVIPAFRSFDGLDGYVQAALNLPQDKAEILVRGATDHLSNYEVSAMATCETPMYGETLDDGSLVYWDKADLLANMRVADQWLRDRGCENTMIFCANDFSELKDIPGYISVSDLVINNALALIPEGGTVGVINPMEINAPYEVRKWDRIKDLGYKVVSTCAAPIIPESPDLAMMSEEEIATAEVRPVEAAQELKEQGADVIILDCLGFTAENRQDVHQATNLPVLDPQGICSRLLTQIFGLS